MTVDEFMACCGSSRWANAMMARQPFANAEALHQAADDIWRSLSEQDWLEAFSKHPKIGENSTAKWSAQEQSGMSGSGADTAAEINRLNTDYFERFGFIFIVCATGKHAAEMLMLLRERMKNSRAQEIQIAAEEQAKITHLRLDKLLNA